MEKDDAPADNNNDTTENSPPAPIEPEAAETVAPEKVPPTMAENKARPSTNAKKWAPLWPLIVVLLVALVGIAGVAYLWQQSQLSATALDTRLAAVSERIDSQDSQARSLQRSLDRLDAKLSQNKQQQQADLKQIQQQLDQQQQRLLALSTTSRDDWLLAEAEYLIQLANQRLLMSKEMHGALGLLKAADDVIRELDDSALFPVRAALAKNIAALRSATKLDVEGLYLALAAVAIEADKLRLFEPPMLKLEAETVAQPEDWQQRLQQGAQAAWQKLRNYIKYHRRDEKYTPRLAPEYEAAVRQNVRLMFEQAQMAMLAGKQSLYQDSLGKARQWLQSYYTLDEAATAAVLAMVQELQQQTVAITVPDISSSRRELKAYIEQRHQRPTVEVPADQGGEQ